METKDLAYIIWAHTDEPRKPGNRYRKWDSRTPYYIHPIWCATMILQETSLPEDLRRNGSLALLYHDVLEDTTAGLPGWLSEDVGLLVSEMTFKSSEDEWENLWQRDERVRLLKLYDKTSNLLDGVWMTHDKRAHHLRHLRRIYEDVKAKYGELNITKLASTLLTPSHQVS